MISIIIPTYNRAHLIGETLDSVLAQTYTNWECLITDDGSTDNSIEIIQEYVNKDTRFKLFTRPASRPKGANACRNIGLEKAVGEYIVFFDSDDLMTPDHLQVKMDGIINKQCDYVITRTKFFNKEDNRFEKYYTFDQYPITPHNYVTQKINWLTYDILLKRELATAIRFNEKLQSGQEYNYFSKLVYKSVNGVFIDKIVTLRREHEQSIRSRLSQHQKSKEGAFMAHWFTYLDIRKIAEKNTRVYLLSRVVHLAVNEKTTYGQPFLKIQYYLCKELGVKSLYFLVYFLSYRLFKRGHFFRKKVLEIVSE